MTKIIGHRGAAGVALENSRESLRTARASGVDMIEFDVHRTADDKLVLLHDVDTARVAGVTLVARDHTRAELEAVRLNNGETLIDLDKALEVVGDTPVIIELKDENSIDELLLVLARHPKARASIASFHHEELRQIRRALPDIPIYVLEHLSPIDIVRSARHMHATGIGLNKWLLNPLTYWLTRRYHLELYMYVVNNPLLARFMRVLYPGVHWCSDQPERLAKIARRT